MARRQYSDADKAAALAALAANGDKLNRTAKETGVPFSTLKAWRDETAVKPEIAELREHKKGELADNLEGLAYKLADAMPRKIRGATLQQVATSMGITIDKMQLLRGKATAITDDASLTDEKRADRITALLDAARARRDGQPAEHETPDVP